MKIVFFFFHLITKERIPVIILVTQFRTRERRKLHFKESNSTNFGGGGGGGVAPPRSSCPQCSRQRHEWCTSASWTTVSGTSKCYRKPCLTLIFLLFQDNDETVEMLASFVDSYPDSDEWEFEYARQVPFFIPFCLCKQFFLVQYFFDFFETS